MLHALRPFRKVFSHTLGRNVYRFCKTGTQQLYFLMPEGPYRLEIDTSSTHYDPTRVYLHENSLKSTQSLPASLLTVENHVVDGKTMYQFISNPSTGQYLFASNALNNFVTSKEEASKILIKNYFGAIIIENFLDQNKFLSIGQAIGYKLRMGGIGSIFKFHPQ